MGAADILQRLRLQGFGLDADGDKLLVTPGRDLTDEQRALIRQHKAELMALLDPARYRQPAPGKAIERPYRLTRADADRCHAPGWQDACIAQFSARVQRFARLGIDAQDADDLAERLTLRDRDDDKRVMCAECRHYRPGRCGNHKAAGLHVAEVGRDLALTLQRCPGVWV